MHEVDLLQHNTDQPTHSKNKIQSNPAQITSELGSSSANKSVIPSVLVKPRGSPPEISPTFVRVDFLHRRCFRVGVIRVFQSFRVSYHGFWLDPHFAVPTFLVLHG